MRPRWPCGVRCDQVTESDPENRRQGRKPALVLTHRQGLGSGGRSGQKPGARKELGMRETRGGDGAAIRHIVSAGCCPRVRGCVAWEEGSGGFETPIPM